MRLHAGLLWLPPHAIAAERGLGRDVQRSLDAFTQRLEDNIADFTLPNGMQFVVLPRGTAPIVSMHTCANVRPLP